MSGRRFRKLHRWMALFVGIPLLGWTISGAVFSWNNIQSVRGEHLSREVKPMDLRRYDVKSSDEILGDQTRPVKAISLRTISVMPVYEVEFDTSDGGEKYAIIDATEGRPIEITGLMARSVAMNDFSESASIKSVSLVETANGEYRDHPLPAWRIEFDHASGTAVYVCATTGRVTARRNSQRKIYDFFRMLHTLDFANGHDFNHWPIKIISLLAVFTILGSYVFGFRSREAEA